MADRPAQGGLTRRTVLQAGAGLAAATTLRWDPLLGRAVAAPLRGPDSLPDPTRAAGTPTDALPFDHLVVVMMENHSFDNYLGWLSRRGQPKADGFTFDAAGRPANIQPYQDGYVELYHAPSRCQPVDVTQSWNATHMQIDGGRMDGFAKTDLAAMAYWTDEDIPFYYSLAKTFTVGTRWFGSAPCQTFPNRRFLLAGTAYGLISTDTASVLDPPPPNGTIFDRLSQHSISWRDYFTDLPGCGVIGSVAEKYPANFQPVHQFFADCATGSLPSVAFVDPEFGAASDVAGGLSALPGFKPVGDAGATKGGDEENPQDITLGEAFVARVVNAVLASPAWPRTLLVWLYDEHGGYYDHVPPPAALAPDAIKPKLGPKDVPGGYDIYGPRVPAVVVSPYARPNAVTSVVHDHTSVLATIEAKWNLPACTLRDANAATLADFLDPGHAAFLDPPPLAAPGDVAASEATCSNADPVLPVHPYPPPTHAQLKQRLVVHLAGRHPLRVALHTTKGTARHVTVELRDGRHTVARGVAARVTTARRELRLHGERVPRGRYTLLVTYRGRTVLRRRVFLR